MIKKQVDVAWERFHAKMAKLKKRQQVVLIAFERRLAEKRISDLKKDMGIE